ncbi:sorting and assembly machinery component 50 homolog B [Harmonia axyridis]|uniref:sorting and assembly machinery component 50 homolog B n=1 Tax=Harmonia axyridis TaxID=115357 RepID=UPI001E279B98|nr:sorting and assembly machinery component 50 homolog B [Harmonia axyridis]
MGIVHAKAPHPPKYPLDDPPLMSFAPNPDDLPKYNSEQGEPDPNAKDIIIEGVSARVDKIHIDGLERTKDDYVQDCFDDLFSATTFQDVLIGAHRARLKLEELGCFKNIAVFVDTSKGVGSTPEGLDVTFNVKEYRRLTGGVSTHIGDNEGSLLVGMKAPNIYGRGEKVQVEYSHGSKKNTQFSLAFIKPLKGKFHPIITASVFQNHSEFDASGFRERGRGILLDLGFHSFPLVKHNIQWEGIIRELGVAGKSTSFEVREQSGATLKSALRHIVSTDMRDDNIFPTGGTLIQNTTEIAGLGGDVGFWKNDVFLQSNISLYEDIVLQSCFGFGLMRGIGNDMKIGLSDMFYLGGPLSFRGFQTRGAGPHSDGDATGALGYWAAGLHLFTPLPFRPGSGGLGELFRTHFFVNTGNIGEFQPAEGEPITTVLGNNLRLSYGIGLALRLGNMARIELNYCVPQIFDENDLTQPGIQFGIGVRFL